MFNRTMDEHTEKPHSNDGYIAIIKFARIDDTVFIQTVSTTKPKNLLGNAFKF